MAGRRTTRVEDSSCYLLGLFGVPMPLLYGEGNGAFTRLQEEIIKTQEDLSVLLWSTATDSGMTVRSPHISSVLGTAPSDCARTVTLSKHPDFGSVECLVSVLKQCSLHTGQTVVRSLPKVFRDGISHLISDPSVITNRGLLLSLNVFHLKHQSTSVELAICVWTYHMLGAKFVCLMLKPKHEATDTVYLRAGQLQLVSGSDVEQAVLRRVSLA